MGIYVVDPLFPTYIGNVGFHFLHSNFLPKVWISHEWHQCCSSCDFVGFFVAAEFALVKARGFRIEALANGGSAAARLTLRIQDDLGQASFVGGAPMAATWWGAKHKETT